MCLAEMVFAPLIVLCQEITSGNFFDFPEFSESLVERLCACAVMHVDGR